MNDLPIRTATPADWPEVAALMQTVFHDTWDEDFDRIEAAVFEPDRSLVVQDAGTIVGHAAAFTRDLTVPGAVIPAAHVTLVGVAPTHRRRRLLTRLMVEQLTTITEPVAVLWASEGRIYPRFGYGIAAQRLSLSINTAEVSLPDPGGSGTPGRLRSGKPADLLADLRRVYESVRRTRPGWSSRNDAWWSYVLSDPASRRSGAGPRRAVLHEGPDGVDGYALWRTRSDWSPSGPQSEVQVKEVVAATPEAYLALWRFLLTIDLTRWTKYWFGAADEPLLYRVDEPRQLGVTLGDGLFLRVVDLPAALSARRYASPVDVVIEVTDALLARNAGRWRLSGDAEKASCVPTDAPADLAGDIADLGAAYLGGVPLTALAAAGRIRELRPGVLAAASPAFGWHRAPVGIEVF